MRLRLPLYLLLIAVAAHVLGGALAAVPGCALLGYLLRGGGGGLLLFLFPTFSVLYRHRPAGAESTTATLLLCALVNPVVLAASGELMVLAGITHSPLRVLALCVLPTLALEWLLRRASPPEDASRGRALVLVLSALAMVAVVVADPRTHRIVESHLLPDQTHELLAELTPGTGVDADLRCDPPLAPFAESRLEGAHTQRWLNSAAESRIVELRWLLHNDSPDERQAALWVDEQLHRRYRVPGRFEPSRRPRDYPPSSTVVVERLVLNPGEHVVRLRPEGGTSPLILFDLTGLSHEALRRELTRRFQIVDVGDVQQVLDIARNFDSHALPWVSNRSQSLEFVGGGVTVVDLPLYHLVLNLALNLIGDDLAGANALFVWLLGWTLLALLVLFDVGRTSRPMAWALPALLAIAVTVTLWRLLPPNDEALFLDAYLTMAGVTLVTLAGRRCLVGGAVAAVVIACTMRAGQLWMVLCAVGLVLQAPRRWSLALRLFGPAVAVSGVTWLTIALAARTPALSGVFGDLLAEDVADRFWYFAMAADPAGLVRERWFVHTAQFIGFCLAGSGGLLLIGFSSRSIHIRALATGLSLYLVALSLLAHHRVAYTVPFIVVGIAVGLAALREPVGDGARRWDRWRRGVLVAAILLVTVNAGRLITTTDDYTRTDGERVLWYGTYPGEPARWLALRALGELENGDPDRAYDLLTHAITLYPYHLPHISYHLGRAALAGQRVEDAAAAFGLTARLEEDACERTRAGAVLLADAGELDLALGVVGQNPACEGSVEDRSLEDLLARVASGEEGASPHLAHLVGAEDVRNCYLTNAFGWPFDVPPSPPAPPR